MVAVAAGVLAARGGTEANAFRADLIVRRKIRVANG
jgi:hypothetical protein